PGRRRQADRRRPLPRRGTPRGDRRRAAGIPGRGAGPTLTGVPPALILSRRDLDFLLYEWLDVESLTKRARFSEHSRETVDGVLDPAERIAAHPVPTHNR